MKHALRFKKKVMFSMPKDSRAVFKKSFFLSAVLIVVLSGCASHKIPYVHPDITVDKTQLYSTVQRLTEISPPRNYQNLSSLNRAAEYIQDRFREYGYRPTEQRYRIENGEYKNIIASYGPETAPRFIVGAHYDVYGNQPGADDNASGVAGLLTLASLFKKYSPTIDFRIDFVAFTLEEPPFFRTESMGSYRHAQSLRDENADVLGMISLEMIGFYTNTSGSQDYPMPLMGLFYSHTGDFIGVVGNYGSSKLIRHFSEALKLTSLPVETLRAPSFLSGVDLSDHMNYWKFGYQSIMITDTSFYRNPNYHKGSDTIETLNFDKMRDVIKGIYFALINLHQR